MVNEEILSFLRAIKDVDVVYDHGSTLLDRAVETFGKGTAEAARHGFYLEAVSSGLPPLPIGYRD